MQIKGWTAFPASDLFVAYVDECGEDYTAEMFYVVIEDPQGRRKAHHVSFNSFEMGLEEAKAAVERLAYRVEFAGEIQEDLWRDINPGYGSDAYILEGGDEAFIPFDL